MFKFEDVFFKSFLDIRKKFHSKVYINFEKYFRKQTEKFEEKELNFLFEKYKDHVKNSMMKRKCETTFRKFSRSNPDTTALLWES